MNPVVEPVETTAETVAIRPEAFVLDENGVEAEIQFISEMGKDQIVTMTYLGNTIRAILNLDDMKVGSGSKIKVGLKKKGVFTFDKEGHRCHPEQQGCHPELDSGSDAKDLR